jgi:hypothetical protein
MKDRLRNMLKGAKEGLEGARTPEAPRAGEKPPRPRVAFHLPVLKNRGRKTTKQPEGTNAETKSHPTLRLVLGVLAGAMALGTLFLVPRLGGERRPEPPAPPPPAPEVLPSSLSSPPPVVPVVPAPPPQGGVSPPPVEGSPASTQSEEGAKLAVPPTPKRARNPFGDPENRASEPSGPKPSPNPSGRSSPPTPPSGALGGLPPLPPPPTGVPQGGNAPKEPPPPPEIACLAVFLGKEASAVVKAAGFEGVVSVGEEVPGMGRLIEVSPNGCVFSVGGRKLKASLEGDRRWQ